MSLNIRVTELVFREEIILGIEKMAFRCCFFLTAYGATLKATLIPLAGLMCIRNKLELFAGLVKGQDSIIFHIFENINIFSRIMIGLQYFCR